MESGTTARGQSQLSKWRTVCVLHSLSVCCLAGNRFSTARPPAAKGSLHLEFGLQILRCCAALRAAMNYRSA